MPVRPKKPCGYPGCGNITPNRYCLTHEAKAKDEARKYDHKRGNSSQRGYNKAWQRIREVVLLRDMFKCQECGKLIMKKGEAHVDHIIPREKHGSDALTNLQTLCHSCHSIKTVRADGGFGRAM